MLARRALCAVVLAACAAEIVPPDLPLGDVPEGMKEDGTWGSALTCKPIPSLPTLPHPEITISLNGNTVHLVDRTTGFDKVFPAGVGKVNTNATESTYGESLTYYPILATGKKDFTLRTSSIEPCKTWWTDPDTGQKSPVFAGLPFMPFYGGYAMHGPIDGFTAPSGGTLRRGFVSHGCVRMESADVLEVYARIRGVASVPVHVQREPERDSSGTRIDVPARWVGSECESDGDCNFTGGFCKVNSVGGRGFCTMRCTAGCPDRSSLPVTFCVADPDDATKGMCTLKTGGQMPDCRSLDSFVPATASRFSQSTVRASVCLPGSPGWVGDRCRTSRTTDCKNGTTCQSGGAVAMCTQSCSGACPDQPGWAMTFCARDAAFGTAPKCMRTCTPASNAPECAAGFGCALRTRPSDGRTKYVCVPSAP